MPTHFNNIESKHPIDIWRTIVASLVVLVCLLVLLGRFIFLQIYKHETFVTKAQNNRISLVAIQPSRGLILDRNGTILARNYSAFTIEVTPNKIAKGHLPNTLEKLQQFIELSPKELKRFEQRRLESKSFEPIPIKLKATEEEAARVSAQLWQLPGIEVQARMFRDYPFNSLTAHVLGYIGRIGPKDIEKIEEDGLQSIYRGATHIGKTGIEYSYEKDLHGTTGFQKIEVDASGRPIQVLQKTAPQDGKTIQLSLDIKLQKIADHLFAGRRGALVAIEPNTGEILAFVSKPSFDPNLFIDGIDSQNWNALNTDWKKPLVNRALRGIYPPGSTFKPFVAMAALQSGVRTPEASYHDPGFFMLPGSTHRFRSPSRNGMGAVNMYRSIASSSDVYYYKLAWDMGIDKLSPLLALFGFGQKTGIDLDGETLGILPSKEWKRKRFSGSRYTESQRRWNPGDVVSIGIGQGYNAYTPLQMARATAMLANNGKVITPHLGKSLMDAQTMQSQAINFPTKGTLPFKGSYYQTIKEAMAGVLKPGGTSWRAGVGLRYTMGGKTGTAQVVQIKQGAKYNAAALAEQHRDHSWFIAFAPVESPQIALAVIVENSGWGATSAVPLTRSFLDYFFLNQIPPGLDLSHDLSFESPAE
jgi:penicillin-binding protein 2